MIKSIYPLLIFFVLTMMINRPAHSQDNPEYYSNNYDCYYYGKCPAYCDSCRAAHWTAYVPIVALVAAALWLGYADKHSKTCTTSSSSHQTTSFSHYSTTSSTSCFSP